MAGRAPRVAVVMPTFNCEAYIGAAIASILAQTLQDFELIIVDNGSKDGTVQVARSYEEVDRRVRVLVHPHGGVSGALNFGIAQSNSEYIARMDGDDISDPRRLEIQIEFMEQNCDVIICGTDMISFKGDSKRRNFYPTTDRDCRIFLLLRSCFSHPTVVIRRGAFSDHQFYKSEYNFAEDYQAWCELVDAGRFHNIGEPLYMYRLHDNQVTHEKRAKQIALHLAISERHHRRLGVDFDKTALECIIDADKVMSVREYKRVVQFFTRLLRLNRIANFRFIRTYLGQLYLCAKRTNWSARNGERQSIRDRA